MSIRIRHLRLRGVSQDYYVDFVAGDTPRTLSIVAGEISTGKTSVLEFIDYCLGASGYPRHQEVQRQVRSALLEVELTGEVAVIERGLDGAQGVAFVHNCRLADIADPHAKVMRSISPPGDPQSLSSLLLEHCGLAGISLREAPTRSDSRTDPLSFRDVMWLCFLSNHRMDGRQLMHEANYIQNIKLRQVIEVVFGIHDDQLAKLGEAIAAAVERNRLLQAEIQSIERFLTEQEVPSVLELQGSADACARELLEVDRNLTTVSASMRASSSFADGLRRQYGQAHRAAASAAARERDRETLLRRLLPLRGQYAEDEKKLVFYEEARALFDPLRITVCPGCLQHLERATTISDGTCSLCGRSVPAGDQPIDVAAELNAVRTRLREIDRYINEIEGDITAARRAVGDANQAESTIQTRLDSTVAQTLAPFVAQRDDLLNQREVLNSRSREIRQQLSLHAGLDRRRTELGRSEETVRTLRQRARELEEQRPSREVVVADLTSRFGDTLRDFHFPKLYDPVQPYLDRNFVPHVRGVPYREIGSTGGLTLISLAWFLAMFGRAVATQAAHPGFLLIDSPQKNLTPRPDSGGEDDFSDPAIVARVWGHLLEMSRDASSGTMQMIVVDNAPPAAAAQHVVVRYGGPLGPSPYGLIENETG